jgi:hypothetical protein
MEPAMVVSQPTVSGCLRGAILCNLLAIFNDQRGTAMKAFLLACAAAIVVAALAAAVLDRLQEPVQQAFATTGVRL